MRIHGCTCATPSPTRGRHATASVALRDLGDQGGSEEIILDRFPGAAAHDGCRLKFGPDGKLYATTGDATQRTQAQDVNSLAGKILRLNPDGSVPDDNPFGPGSLVYSYGHRNPQGLAFHPVTGSLYETEHGPSGEVGIGNYDEVNVIVPGHNYGWPLALGAPHLPQFEDPLLSYPDAAVPPAGATFYFSTRISQWTGNLLLHLPAPSTCNAWCSTATVRSLPSSDCSPKRTVASAMSSKDRTARST